MKTKWGIIAGFASIALAVAIGCDTSGGSSITDGPGSTNRPVVVQICFSVPDCASNNPAIFNGAAFGGGAGYLYIAPNCADTNDSTYVWLKVVTDVPPSSIKEVTWTIRNWGTENSGTFTADSYDQLLQNSNGVFRVSTLLNQVRYKSTSTANLLALTDLFNEQIDVTVETWTGQFTSGAISLKLHNGMNVGDELVYDALQSADVLSNPGGLSNLRHPFPSYADYFVIEGTGDTNNLVLESTLVTPFATAVVLYNTNLTAVATNEGIFSGSRISQITQVLADQTPYIVEVTSATNQAIGSYTLRNDTGPLMPMPNPFPFAACQSSDSISGTFGVTDSIVIDLTINGQTYAFTNIITSTTEVMPLDCHFTYAVNDPTGLIPPMVRMGRVEYNNILLYSDAFIPQSPEIVIVASAVSGTGRLIDNNQFSVSSSGTIEGTFLGQPFSIQYSCESWFQKP